MNPFSAIPEPWARVYDVVVMSGIGALFGFLLQPWFGVGMACGAVTGILLHWAGRIDERPFWQHVLGPEVVSNAATREERLEEEVWRLKLKVAELLGQQANEGAAAHGETGVKATLEGPKVDAPDAGE
jgi:hypothetical protein